MNSPPWPEEAGSRNLRKNTVNDNSKMPLKRMYRGLCEGGDDLAERGEALVDVGALLEPRARGARRLGALRAGQVDEGDLADLLGGEPGGLVVLVLREDDGEDGVRAGGRLVHVGRRHSPEEEERRVKDDVSFPLQFTLSFARHHIDPFYLICRFTENE